MRYSGAIGEAMRANRTRIIIFGLGLLIGAAVAVAFYELDGRAQLWLRYDQWLTARDNRALLATDPLPGTVRLERTEILPASPSSVGFANDQAYFEQLISNSVIVSRNEGLTPLTSVPLQSPEQFLGMAAPHRARLGDYLGPLGDGSVSVRSRETVQISHSLCPDGPALVERVIVASRWSELDVPIYLLTPPANLDNGYAIIALHGHSSSPEQLIGLEAEDYARQLGLRLVCAGYAVIVPAVTSNGAANSAISARLALTGETLYGLMVSIVQSSIDVGVATFGERPIGLYGISNGALLALLTSALDERVRFVVAETILSPYWETTLIPTLNRSSRKEYFYYFNGPVWQQYDIAQLAMLSLPEPLIFTVGSLDPVTVGWEDEWGLIQGQYAQLGLANQIDLIHFHGHHELAENHAIDRLGEMLP